MTVQKGNKMTAPEYPSINEFGPWRTPNGATWGPGDGTCNDGPCVTVAEGPDGWVAVTDNKIEGAPVLMFDRQEWADFREAVKRGDM